MVQHFEDLGKLLLRLGLGGMLLLHGIYKIQNGIDGMDEDLAAKGLPVALKYGVYIGEVAAPILIIIGFLTRIGGLCIAGNMAMAIYLKYSSRIFTRIDHNGGWTIELPMLYLVGGLALVFLGGGKFALWRRGGPLG